MGDFLVYDLVVRHRDLAYLDVYPVRWRRCCRGVWGTIGSLFYFVSVLGGNASGAFGMLNVFLRGCRYRRVEGEQLT